MYTLEMQKVFQAFKPPVPITVDIATAPDGLRIVVYQDEIMSYEKLDRIVIMDYLQQLQKRLRGCGAEVELEGRAGKPN